MLHRVKRRLCFSVSRDKENCLDIRKAFPKTFEENEIVNVIQDPYDDLTRLNLNIGLCGILTNDGIYWFVINLITFSGNFEEIK